jgi:hypothetical protein
MTMNQEAKNQGKDLKKQEYVEVNKRTKEHEI